MLTDLSIRHVALIDELSLAWQDGFWVLSGETGAGKSILIDAVTLVLGGKADKELIRTGADRAIVEARFSTEGNRRLLLVLDELGIERDEDAIILAREITRAGRSVCRVNGSMVPLAGMRRIAACLVDIHGQHELQGLLDPARHLAFLDAYGKDELHAPREAARAAYVAYRETRKALDRIEGDARGRAQRLDMLRHQVQEIDAAKLRVGETAELEQRRDVLQNAERIGEALERAYHLTYRGTERAPSALAALKTSTESVASIIGYSDAYVVLRDRLQDLYYQLEDVAHELRAHKEDAETDPVALDEAEGRLDAIGKILRKYGVDEAAVLAFREEAAAELAELEGGEESADALRAQLANDKKALDAACEALSRARRAVADRFEAGMLGELKDLGMEKARFSVAMTRRAGEISAYGWDAVEFQISPNPGEPLKSLSRIASGGELSRLMLAMKKIGADADDVPTLIFDEIDTGISGRMAAVVGEKMASIARSRQVLCVTHLPQIAALGDGHLLVEKHTDGERTNTSVRALSFDERVHEIARMAGGATITEAGLSHARELLKARERA